MKKEKKTRLLLLLFSLIFLITLVTGGAFLGISQLEFKVHLKGDPEIVLEYGEPYEEAGAYVTLSGRDFWTEETVYDIPVEIQGNIPNNQVGTFYITYRAQKLGVTGEATRTVTVADTVPPEITLVTGNAEQTGPYIEEGYSAFDNVDGDLTDKVIRKEYEGEVRYTVEDSSGNQATVSRQVTTFDITPPDITLEGEKHLLLPYGTPWEEPGYHAEDSFSGDLTDQVIVEGKIDPWLPGTYSLLYTVSDGAGNQSICTRTVEVTAAPREEVIWPKGKTIYLTFDDGPGPYTNQLLDVLAKYNVKATFFVVGSGYAQQMQRIVNEGHSIAAHSMTHNYRQIYESPEAYFADILGEQRAIEANTGVKTTLMRFPGGSSNLVSSFTPGIMTTLTEAVQDAGFQYFDWNVDSNDAGGARTAEQVFLNVTEGCRRQNVSVVLQHDIHPFSVAAVEDIILWGKSNGYQFLPLDKNSYGAHHGVNN